MDTFPFVAAIRAWSFAKACHGKVTLKANNSMALEL